VKDSVSIRRIACGIIAISFIGFAIVTYFYPLETDKSELFTAFAARAGAIFGVLWLAWPQLKKFNLPMPTWFMAMCGVGIIVAVRSAQTLIVIVPILTLAYFLGRVWRGDVQRANLAEERKQAANSKEKRP
jgi:UDP-N-acetylmuramyl pentapeptide phosphotransferase/UDP-N-acetylglucosamine-1-phosphate transferase